MIVVEIRSRQGAKQTIGVHRRVTVVGGLDDRAKESWAEALRTALQGQATDHLDVDVEFEGRRQKLTPEVAKQLGLAAAGTVVTVTAGDLPGAIVGGPTEVSDGLSEAPAPAPEPSADLTAAEAAVAEAEVRVEQLLGQLEEATRASTAAADELTSTGRRVDEGAPERVKTLQQQLEAARSAAGAARRNLEGARKSAQVEQEAAASVRAQVSVAVTALQAERSDLEIKRSELVGRMVEIGDPGDPEPVEQALDGLRRLRQVRAKPSPAAVDLADRWVAARQQLATLPAPPQPPDWLVAPALSALQEARDALAQAESGTQATTVEPSQVATLDRAHREVLEAEQRSMRKGSRTNRRRLEQAQEAERTALAALGASSYGEYLQRVAPGLEGGGPSAEERVSKARAALADAEAVWEELHGGQASPEWTAAKEEQAAVRVEAQALVGDDVSDDRLEDALRGHLQTVVDTAWAEQALAEALRNAGGGIRDGHDLESAAESWLAEAPAHREARARADAELSELDGRLAAVERELTEHKADAFFGNGEGSGPSAPPPGGDETPDPMQPLIDALSAADAAEKKAEADLAAAHHTLHESEAQQGRLEALEREADQRRRAVDELQAQLTEAEAAVAAARQRAVDAAPAPAATPAAAPTNRANGGADLSKVVPMEVELYVLARLAALRAAPSGPLPLVVDGAVVAGLPAAPGKRLLGLLERAAGTVQVVVLGDDGPIAAWAEGLGDQAAVQTVAR